MILPEKIKLNKGDRILICRTDRIGDLILTIPLIETMKLRCPECGFDILASEYAAPILENNPCINNIIPVEIGRLKGDRNYFKSLMLTLKENNYRAALAVYPDRAVARLLYKAGVINRIGTARRFHSILFNRHLFHSRKKSERHESEYNLDFLKFFKEGESVRIPSVYLKESELEEARRLLESIDLKEPFIVIHPGSKGSAPAWPTGHFAGLYENLTENGLNVILTGSLNEVDVIQYMEKRIKAKIRNIVGKTGLRTLAAVLSLAGLVVANSTGPLHIAAASGTSVIGFYPNDRVMSPKRWGPLGEGHTVFTPEPGAGMDSIPVADVADAVMSRMDKAGASS